MVINKHQIGKNKYEHRGHIVNTIERSELENHLPIKNNSKGIGGWITANRDLPNSKSIIIDTLQKVKSF